MNLFIFASCLVVCLVSVFFLVMHLLSKSSAGVPVVKPGPDSPTPGKYPETFPRVGLFNLVSSRDHHTDMYKFSKNNTFIVRRAMPFVVENATVNMQNVRIEVKQLVNEYKAAGTLKTKKVAMYDATYQKYNGVRDFQSSFTVVPVEAKCVSVVARTNGSVTLAATKDCPVGHYLLRLDDTSIDLYILFNPYSADDSVHMPDTSLLEEYIANENGIIFKGTIQEQDYNLVWDYAQFDEEVFKSTMSLLVYLQGYTDFDAADPANVARNLTYGIGNNVATGNWTENSLDAITYPANEMGERTKCDTLNDCLASPQNTVQNFNLCQQPYKKDFKAPTVCGMTSIQGKDEQHVSDFIPLISSDQYRACTTKEDCTGVDITLPLSYDASLYTKDCLESNICGYDVYGGPENPPGSKSPYYWTSSKEILGMYYNSMYGGKKAENVGKFCNRENSVCVTEVKYVQCWVLAALLNTMCRTIGIPARQICCYLAAHESCASLDPPTQCVAGIGKFTGEMVIPAGQVAGHETPQNGAIWSFHNWNEVFMSRPDLTGSQYNGSDWQVIDATAQELSNGINLTGPAPVSAVRDNSTGKIKGPVNFDVSFVSSEVKYSYVWLDRYGQRTQVVPQRTLVVTYKPGALEILSNPNAKLVDIQTDLTDLYAGPAPAKSMLAGMAGPESETSQVQMTLRDPSSIQASLRLVSEVTGDAVVTIFAFPIQYRGDRLGKPLIDFQTKVAVQKMSPISFQKTFDIAQPEIESPYLQINTTVEYPDGKTFHDISRLYLKSAVKIEINSDNGTISMGRLKPISIVLKNPIGARSLKDATLRLRSKNLGLDEHINIGTILPGKNIVITRQVKLARVLHESIKKIVIDVQLDSARLLSTIRNFRVFQIKK